MDINKCMLAGCCSNEPFLWGASTSAFQVEGSTTADGRGMTIWDTFVAVPGNIADGENANIACNSYIQYVDDINALKLMGVNSYRFSICWSRILPNGSGEINQKGINHYNNVINACVQNGIIPVVTLYHWDLPQALQNKYNGWLCTTGEIWSDFSNYANICFREFGDRVKHWITINEPQTIAIDCYEYNWYAPGSGTSNGISPDGNEYSVAHNVLISHAYAVNLYRKLYSNQNGKIGITCNMDWGEPYTNSDDNIKAAERANVFWGGWFWDPIFFGDYPEIMKQMVGSRLPPFTTEQSNLIQGSIDILFLNTYTTNYIYKYIYTSDTVGWTYDANSATTYYNNEGVIIGPETQSSWLHITPWGVNKLLLWIQNRYNYNGSGSGIGIRDKFGNKRKIPLMITENGMDILGKDQTTTYTEAFNNEQQINYYSSYLENIAQAVKTSGIDFKGYLPWALLDNFEWTSAYTCRFGLFYLDCNSSYNIPRLPKKSVFWFKNYISTHPNGPTTNIYNSSSAIYSPQIQANTPWVGGPIRGYYYWTNNFYIEPYNTVNASNTLNCLDTVTQTQEFNPNSGQTTDFTQKTYNISFPTRTNNAPDIIDGTNFNAIFIFTQYTNYNEIALHSDLTTLSSNATTYFSNNNIGIYLLGLCFGGGWTKGYSNTGDDVNLQPGAFTKNTTLFSGGSLASIYTAITPLDDSYQYLQDDGFSVTVTGTGNITHEQYNCLLFDIELGNITANDFVNLYGYIKSLYPEMIIITAINHTCAYWSPEDIVTQDIIKSELSDYICPIMYSQMFGTTTEYLPNSNLSWSNFFNLLQQNPKFIKYGMNYILPNIYTGYPFNYNGTTILDTYTHGGSNHNNPPNNYYYQSTGNDTTPVIESNGGSQESLGYYNKDTGVVDFINATSNNFNINSNISTSSTLGGFIQWNNFQSS
jgi:beta-glucosidase